MRRAAAPGRTSLWSVPTGEGKTDETFLARTFLFLRSRRIALMIFSYTSGISANEWTLPWALTFQQTEEEHVSNNLQVQRGGLCLLEDPRNSRNHQVLEILPYKINHKSEAWWRADTDQWRFRYRSGFSGLSETRGEARACQGVGVAVPYLHSTSISLPLILIQAEL